MKAFRIFSATLLSLSFLSFAAQAAETSVSVGAGVGSDSTMAYSLNARQTYDPLFGNEAAELRPFAELGLHAWTGDDDTVWGASLAPGLLFTLFTDASFQPYLAGSVGGAVNTEDHIDGQELGSNALFRTKGQVGAQFGEGLRHRIQGEYTNYSTWGIADKDDGYNVYGISYGYNF